MTVLVNISLAVCYGAYVLDLAVLNCECELGHCCEAVGCNCLFKTVLAVLEACELSAVALKLHGLVISCKCLCLFAFAYNYSAEILVIVLNCKHECCLAR